MDRRETVGVFRRNLSEVIARSGLSRSAFATRLGLDRSTLSQLLSADDLRLPRAETIASVAAFEQVRVDWLLGLSQEGRLGAGLPTDERLRLYSMPKTIFGTQRVAVYFGNMYIAFNSTEHIRELTGHFDRLIRAAVIQPTDMAGFLKGLLEELGPAEGEPKRKGERA